MKSQIMKFIVVLAAIIVFACPISAQQSGEHDFNFEYAAKIICGTINKSDNSRLARGAYATTINIHNPNDTSVEFLKKLALTFPPEQQSPGRIDTIGIDKLGPDEALKVDCMDIQRRLFPNGFPSPGYIEGFVIIKSTKSLDVTAVYTSAKLSSFLSPQNVTSIDVEKICERKIEELPPPKELDHFKIYEVNPIDTQIVVFLKGQFDDSPKYASLGALTHFANPTWKILATSQIAIKDTNRHFNLYKLMQSITEPIRTVRFTNQFGQHSVDIDIPTCLLVPAQKTSDPRSSFPDCLDHYKCYKIIKINVLPNLPTVTLKDQFGSENSVQILKPCYFCVPVSKSLPGVPPEDGIINDEDHLVIYDIPPTLNEREITVKDQFGERTLKVIKSVMLAVPTKKQVVAPH